MVNKKDEELTRPIDETKNEIVSGVYTETENKKHELQQGLTTINVVDTMEFFLMSSQQ